MICVYLRNLRYESKPMKLVSISLVSWMFGLLLILAKVFVFETDKPTARLTALPERVPFGQTFKLSAEGSKDVGSGIKTFIWTRID